MFYIFIVYLNKISIRGNNQDIITRYNRAYGSKLKKIYWTPYNNTESANTADDHNNFIADMSKILSSFYTEINNTQTI